MKVIIAGGRDFFDYFMLKEKCDKILSNQSDVIIISGKAKGADSVGMIYAEKSGYGLELFPPEWGKYGKRAGFLRNEQMAIVADALIAFWDGKSKGTQHMINIAREKGLKVRVIKY